MHVGRRLTRSFSPAHFRDVYFHFNLLGGVLVVVAMFGAFLLVGHLGGADGGRGYLPFVFAYWLIGLDLILRMFGLRRIAARAAQGVILTRDGPIAAPRKPAREWFEALSSGEGGGQFFLLPMWLVGVAIITITLLWRQG